MCVRVTRVLLTAENRSGRPKKKKPESVNFIEDHKKAVLRDAPEFSTVARVEEVLKWLGWQAPRPPWIRHNPKKPKRSDIWHYVPEKDGEHVDEWFYKVDRFLKYMEDKKNYVKELKSWVAKRRKQWKDIDVGLEYVGASEIAKKPVTWRYSKKMNLKGYAIGDKPKVIPSL